MTFHLQIERKFKLAVLVSLPVGRRAAVAMRTDLCRVIRGPERESSIAWHSDIGTWLVDDTRDQHCFAVARNFKSP